MIIEELIIVWVIAAFLGLITAVIADKKGRNSVIWWFFGTALFIVALPLILILDPIEGSGHKKRCPKCAEWIGRQAMVCRFCCYEYGPTDDLRIVSS
jgi:hypothetical protein